MAQKEQPLDNDVIVGAIGVARDVFIAIFGDDQNVVFAVSPCARLALGNGQHGLHGNHHAWL